MLTIGIAGGSGSGKMTLSKFLADGLSQRQFMVNDSVLREKNEEIVNEYLDLVRHRHDLYVEPTRWYADMVINGSRGKPKGNQVLLEWLLQKLEKNDERKERKEKQK